MSVFKTGICLCVPSWRLNFNVGLPRPGSSDNEAEQLGRLALVHGMLALESRSCVPDFQTYDRVVRFC